jgi:hypothetical protein
MEVIKKKIISDYFIFVFLLVLIVDINQVVDIMQRCIINDLIVIITIKVN